MLKTSEHGSRRKQASKILGRLSRCGQRTNAMLEAMEAACQVIGRQWPGLQAGQKARALLFTPYADVSAFELALAGLAVADLIWLGELHLLYWHLVLGDWRRARIARRIVELGVDPGLVAAVDEARTGRA